jgi:8-oxo-dGTP diphosphatase
VNAAQQRPGQCDAPAEAQASTTRAPGGPPIAGARSAVGPAWVADPDRPRSGGVDRPVVEVAVGILIRGDASFLMTTRPKGKAYESYWEFPGGKLEAGESVQDALRRELREELGVEVERAELWSTEMVDYPHALVRLNFCKVVAWTGELTMHEGQQASWQQLPVEVAPVLPGTVPVLAILAAERGFVGATH